MEWFCRLQSKTLLDLQEELLVVLAEAPPGGDWWDLQSRQPILTLIHSEVKGAFYRSLSHQHQSSWTTENLHSLPGHT